MVAPAIQLLRDQIKQLEGEVRKIQDQCPHPHFMLKKRHTNHCSMEYGPADYYTHFHCELCDKRWTVDGSV
jgi:hypothetical protein